MSSPTAFAEALATFDEVVAAFDEVAPSDWRIAEILRDEACDLAATALYADAIQRLECFTDPKWECKAACRSDYRVAMAEKRARTHPLAPE